MFRFHAVQAAFGDCLLLEYGTAGRSRWVLIDGGPPRTFDHHLDPALRALVGQGGELDLLILSHIDNDHVVGVLDLFAALEDDRANNRPPRVRVGELWHNSFARTLDPGKEIFGRLQALTTLAGASQLALPLATDAFLGVREGHRLRIDAHRLGVPVNRNFPNDLIQVETAPGPVAFGPLQLQVVGPNQANLDELRREWLEWLARTEERLTSSLTPDTAAMSDKSVPNLSSIVLVATCDERSILLTGDARGDHILGGLESAGVLNGGKAHFDVLKVQHHGSNRNTSRTFFQKVTADDYLISADGRHGNPDGPTLKWIVETAHEARRQIRLFVTNETQTTQGLLASHPPRQFGYELLTMPAGEHSMYIELAG